MRIRPIKPEFWEDKELHTRLTAAEREFYIGLWMLADDTGILKWKPGDIAAALYRYQDWQAREKDVADMARKLQELDRKNPHLRVLSCKKHAEVSRLPEHIFVGRWSGAPYKALRVEHEARCGVRKNSNGVSPDTRGLGGKGGRGSVVRGGEESRASAHEETVGGLKARLGNFEDVISGRRH